MPRPSSVTAMATAELAAANNDVQAATLSMTQKVMGNPTLYHELMNPLVRNACYNVITNLCSQRRQIIWQQPQPTAAQNRTAVSAAANGSRLSLFNFQIAGGKELGNAVWSEINKDIQSRGKRLKTESHELRWLTLVAKPMKNKPTKTVRQIFTLAKLQSLKAKANKGKTQ